MVFNFSLLGLFPSYKIKLKSFQTDLTGEVHARLSLLIGETTNSPNRINTDSIKLQNTVCGLNGHTKLPTN